MASGRIAPAALAVLALLSLGLSALPLAAKAVLAIAVLGQGIRQWRREPPPAPVFELSAAGVHADGVFVDAFEVHARGPIAVLHWQKGRSSRRWVAWPGTLDAAGLRELRLAANRMAMAGLTPGLAP